MISSPLKTSTRDIEPDATTVGESSSIRIVGTAESAADRCQEDVNLMSAILALRPSALIAATALALPLLLIPHHGRIRKWIARKTIEWIYGHAMTARSGKARSSVVLFPRR